MTAPSTGISKASLELVEWFTKGKKPGGAGNEDGVVLTEHCIAVVDGATAKGPLLFDGKLSGEFAKDVVAKALAQATSATTPQDLVRQATHALYEEVLRVTEQTPDSIESALRPSASIIAYLPAQGMLVIVGDCHASVDGQLFRYSLEFDDVAAEVRSRHFAWLTSPGEDYPTVDEQAQAAAGYMVAPLLRLGAAMRNKAGAPYSFSVVDGTPIPFSLVHLVPVPAGTQELLLSSDGYPALFSTWRATESHLQGLLERDPLCIRELKGVKGRLAGNSSFDDRTYIKMKAR